MSQYPEHDKLAKISSKSQIVGEFMEWVQDRHCASLHHYVMDHNFPVSLNISIRDLLAEFFEIDQKVIDQEKQNMLDKVRALAAEQ